MRALNLNAIINGNCNIPNLAKNKVIEIFLDISGLLILLLLLLLYPSRRFFLW